MQSFFEFPVSVINHNHINGLYLSWDSFEWFCIQIVVDISIVSLRQLRDGLRNIIDVIYQNILDVSKSMQPLNMIMIYYWDKRNGGHLEHVL